MRDRGQDRFFHWLLGGLFAVLAAALAWRFWFEGTSRRIAELNQLAHVARLDRDPQQVITLTQEWCALAPHDALPFVMQAEAHQEQGDLGKAAEVLEQLPDTDPRSPQALLELSHLYFGDVNLPLSGVRTCERVIRISLSGLLPESDGLAAAAEANRRLVFFYGITRQRNKLLTACRAAIAGGYDLPETYIYLLIADRLHLTNALEVSALWSRGIESNEAIHVAFVLAALLESEGEDADNIVAVIEPNAMNLTEQQQAFLSALAEYPHDSELLQRELRGRMIAGDTAQVVVRLRDAPRESADDSRFWRYRGWVLSQRQEWAAAEVAYRKSLELYPFDFVSRFQLAGVLRQSGRLDEVREQEALATEGKSLQQAILKLPDVRSASVDMLRRMADHFDHCGESYTAACLRKRLE